MPVPPTLPTTASLEAALEAMRSSLREASDASTDEEQLTGNCVLVLEGQQLVGILTERDAVRWALSDRPPNEILLGAVMTHPVISRQRHECLDILATMSLLRRQRIRHLPIVDERNQPAGIVTITSLNRVLKETFFLRFRQAVEVMSTTVVTVRPQDTLRQAIQTMALRGISCVVVTEPIPGRRGPSRERPIGILTERDILQMRRLALAISTTRVDEVMSAPLACIHPADDLAAVRDRMQKLRIRRMVVANDDGELVGLITESNLMQSIDPVDLYGVYEILQRQVTILREGQFQLLSRQRFDLSRALANGEFRLVYQPLLNLSQGKIRSAEALIRWTSPQHGTVPPCDFIPLAEHSGFIVELGDWILETACQQIHHWLQAGGQPIQIAVNVTAHQLLEPQFVAKLLGIVERAGIPPALLKLELTESVLVENTMATAHCFQELQKQGIQIAIDDFGTGYASLSYLQHFSFDTLKVDQSFVRGIHTNPKAQVIVHSVLDMAEKMGFTTVAEGVEFPEELQWLRNAGCQVIQGYLIGKPLPPEQWRPEWLSGALLPPIGATTESDRHGEAQEALSSQ
ncbi:EAL domain-containing protein [Synechococcus sp. CCY9202]|uniref:EAL domain-containing protein n=1 Tax=Synechococcus sp. CCY9202 TaxID=174698 RepID=UPI002B1F6C53|nr:EAL domain-containing protein [Synechococcus sp. CCY9202]MEA5422366.1 EAL domain-containing protein [Synechococcus sp. CCY9202]